MSLKLKVLIVLGTFYFFYAIAALMVQYFVLYPSFLDLERSEANKDMDRVIQALNGEIGYIDTLCHDWGAWNDTYDFMKSRSQDYIESNTAMSTFIDNDLNLIYYLDNYGKTAWGVTYGYNKEKEVPLNLFEGFEGSYSSHPLIQKKGNLPLSETNTTGILSSRFGPILISARPILTSDNIGPVRGTLLMGRFLLQPTIDKLKRQTKVDFQVVPIMGEELTEKQKIYLDKLSVDPSFQVEEESTTMLNVYNIYKDIHGKPAILIIAKINRKISMNGELTIRYALYSLLIEGIMIMIIIWLLLHWTILKPTSQLRDHVLSISKTADLTARLEIKKNDELGELYHEFDHMMDQLVKTRKKLQEQSYYAGMAEMMAGLLHNIRNTLNPAVGNLDLIQNTLRAAPIKNVKKTEKELTEGEIAEEREKALIRYLILASADLSERVQLSDEKLATVAERINEVEQILEDHRHWAYSSRPMEKLVLKTLIHESIRMLSDEFRENIRIDWNPELSEMEPFNGFSVLLKQVFVNVLLNAAESIQKRINPKSTVWDERGHIQINASIDTTGNNRMIHIRINDNGEGMEKETLKKVFARGYSSKENSSGIGLHWCSNIITSMHGKIYAASNGLGEGSTIHIHLPMDKKS